MAPRITPPVAPPEVYVPTTTGTLKVKGRIYTFIRGRARTQNGELLRVDHPLVKAHPDLFTVLDLESEAGPAIHA